MTDAGALSRAKRSVRAVVHVGFKRSSRPSWHAPALSLLRPKARERALFIVPTQDIQNPVCHCWNWGRSAPVGAAPLAPSRGGVNMVNAPRCEAQFAQL